MKFDLDAVDTRTLSEDGVFLNLKTIDREPLLSKAGKQVRVKLLGPDSDKYRGMFRKQMRTRIERNAPGGKEKAAEVDEFVEGEKDALDVMVACTVGWENVHAVGGDAVPCSPENVRALYTAYPVIRDQVDMFIAQRGNFLLASLKG